jgi:hypothetical protein
MAPRTKSRKPSAVQLRPKSDGTGLPLPNVFQFGIRLPTSWLESTEWSWMLPLCLDRARLPFRQKLIRLLSWLIFLGSSAALLNFQLHIFLISFNRFNAFFAKELLKYQPISEDASITRNSMRYRGIEGFVAAVSPFNFTAIGGNLAYTPALMVRMRFLCPVPCLTSIVA